MGELEVESDKEIYLTIGNIIDKKSREFIKNKYKEIKNIFDLENNQKKFLTNEQQALKTKELILQYDNLIIFQPVFIYKNLITKSDTLVKNKNKIYIIETKGTTSAKFVHYLDLLFQKQVIENQDYLKALNPKFFYELCLIEYNYLNKNDVTLQTTPFINLSKTVSITTQLKKLNIQKTELATIKNNIKKGIPYNNEITPLKIKDLIYQNYDDLSINCGAQNFQTRQKYEKCYEAVSNINNEFFEVMKKLQAFKDKLNDKSFVKFQPSEKDKSIIKNCDYFQKEKKIYALMGYKLFNFSGNVASQSAEDIKKTSKKAKIEDFLKKPKANPDFYLNLFKKKKKIVVNKSLCNEFLQKLKSTKVYFDFETINSPIRVIDNSLPFMQIVTQCSIITWNQKQKVEDLKCNNLIRDPKKIDIQWFKKVIDSLYAGNTPVKQNEVYTLDKENEVSYIVYNKSFECTRLKEMADFINEDLYWFKINQINNNIFDLADFFKINANPKRNPYLIFFKELFGFYSIKKVLPLINKYDSQIYALTKCLDYNGLEIGNGLVCQNKTTERFLNLVNDSEWKKLAKQMQIYCENDVRSMIAIELFVRNIISKN